MKIRKLLWIGVLFLPLFACEDPDTTIESEAHLQLIIPLSSTELKSTESATNFMFSGFTTFCLANKDNAQNCPSHILRVMPGKGALLTMPTFEGELSSLTLEWGFGDMETNSFEMQTPIVLTSENMSGQQAIVIDLDEVLLPVIDKIDSNPKTYFKLSISGNADCRISSVAQMKIPIIVEHEAISPRFTL